MKIEKLPNFFKSTQKSITNLEKKVTNYLENNLYNPKSLKRLENAKNIREENRSKLKTFFSKTDHEKNNIVPTTAKIINKPSQAPISTSKKLMPFGSELVNHPYSKQHSAKPLTEPKIQQNTNAKQSPIIVIEKHVNSKDYM